MASRPRRDLIDESVVGIYHCATRCVRRAFLCGQDPYSGIDYDHRKTWIRDRLVDLAAVMAVEPSFYAAMDNHLELLDWTARELRMDQGGAVPLRLSLVLERLGLQERAWLACIRDFQSLFKTAIGGASSLAQHAHRLGQRWLHGLRRLEAVLAGGAAS